VSVPVSAVFVQLLAPKSNSKVLGALDPVELVAYELVEVAYIHDDAFHGSPRFSLPFPLKLLTTCRKLGLSGSVHKSLRSSLATYAHAAAGLYPSGSRILRFRLRATTTCCTGEAVISMRSMGNFTSAMETKPGWNSVPPGFMLRILSVPKEDY
jgi:hypothetical protein